MAGTSPAGLSRTARLVSACEAALARLETKEAEGIDPDIFAELGEVLFWLGALAEAKGPHKDTMLLGLQWARNRITHGVIVAAPTTWHYGSELGRLVLGLAVLGTVSGHEWLARHKIALGPNDKSKPDQEKAYDAEIVGHRIIEILRRALERLR